MTDVDLASPDDRLRWLRSKAAADAEGRWFLPLAGALLEFGFLSEALRVLRAGLAQNPEPLAGWILFGRALLQAGQLDVATRVFDNVLAQDRDNVVALKTMAEVASRAGDQRQAAACCRRLLAIVPGDLEVQRRLAELSAEESKPPAPAERAPGWQRLDARLEEAVRAVEHPQNGASPAAPAPKAPAPPADNPAKRALEPAARLIQPAPGEPGEVSEAPPQMVKFMRWIEQMADSPGKS